MRSWHIALPEDGTLVPKHVSATCLTIRYVTNNAYLVGTINLIHLSKNERIGEPKNTPFCILVISPDNG
jgi:hypothetical protein